MIKTNYTSLLKIIIMKKEYIFIFYSLIAFCISFFIINKYYSYIPIHENTITDYIQFDDLPFYKDYFIFYDLTYCFLFFIIVFSFLDKIENSFLRYNLKIIWIIKNFISLFLIIIYEKNAGLDQVQYFDIINNEKSWAQHFGYIYDYINFDNPTSNYLLIFNYLNIFLFNTWFAIKLFINLFYLATIYLSYKIYLKINKFDSTIVFYLFALFPSFLLFTSILTKDFLIVFYVMVSLHCVKEISKEFNKNIKYFIIIAICIFLITTIRVWMGPLILISLIAPYVFEYFFKIFKSYNYFGFLLLFILIFTGLLFFLESNIWNNLQINLIVKQFDRIHNWHEFDHNHYSVIGVNAENIKQFLINDFWRMMLLSVFNPFLNHLSKFQFYPFILENILIIFLIFYSFFNKKFFFDKIILALIFFVLGYSILYSYAGGYLNSGTSLRYAMQVKYPLFIYLISLNMSSLEIFMKKFFYFLSKKLR